MRTINYKSDFDFYISPKDAKGDDIGIPSYDWTLTIFTKLSPNKVYKASHTGGTYTNCIPSDGRLHIICDNHGLGKGKLYAEFKALIPNADYPDGTQTAVTPFALDITLADAPTDAACVTVTTAIPVAVVTAYELAVSQGYAGTQQQFWTAMSELPALAAEVQQLREQISEGTLRNGSLINLSATDRDTQWTLATAIGSIPSPHFGALLMFVGEGGAWQMWQFTGRDYSSQADWQPVGVRLSASALFIASSGIPSDIAVTAAASTDWAVN